MQRRIRVIFHLICRDIVEYYQQSPNDLVRGATDGDDDAVSLLTCGEVLLGKQTRSRFGCV